MRKEVIGNCELYLGDCFDILPEIGNVDAVITDPPYGIKWEGCAFKDGVHWDDAIPQKEVFDFIFRISGDQIIFGMNYFIEYLKNTRCILSWEKQMGHTKSFSHFELAWTSFSRPCVIFKCEPPGARGWWKNPSDSTRYHPAQKPIALMRYCLELLPYSKTILDPFMGSGTTGVACIDMGRRFIGIEKNEGYFEAACLRIKKAFRDHTDLFAAG